MKKIIVLKADGNVAGYDTIQAGVTNAVSGDCVVVYPGHYVETVTIKNGVDLNCIGSVTIDAVIDGGVTCVCKISGSPTITTTTLTGSGSAINSDKGLPYKLYIARITQSGTSAPTVITEYINTVGAVILERSLPGVYTVNFPTVSNVNKVIRPAIRTALIDDYGAISGFVSAPSASTSSFVFGTYSSSGDAADDILGEYMLEFRILI